MKDTVVVMFMAIYTSNVSPLSGDISNGFDSEAFFYFSAPMVPSFRHGGHWELGGECVRDRSDMYELDLCICISFSVVKFHEYENKNYR